MNLQHKHIIERWFFDLFTAQDIVLLDELVTPAFSTYDPSGKIGAANPQAFKVWLQSYFATCTEPEWILHDILSDGDKAVVRYSGKTTYKGGFFDIPSTNQRVTEMGILIFQIIDGKVHRLWSALSDLEYFLELGAIPTVKSTSE